MVRRVFWFSVGAGVTVYAAVTVRRYLRAARPEAVGQGVRSTAVGVGDAVRDFSATVRAAMAEREAELRAALSQPE